MSKKQRTKRTPEETQAAVDRAKDLVKKGVPVADALAQEGLQPSSWYKYKNKRKAYEKKEPKVHEVQPIDLISGKKFTIITNDPEVIEKFLGSL